MKGKYFVIGIGVLVVFLALLYLVSIRHIERLETVYTGPVHKVDTTRTFAGKDVHNLNITVDGAHIRVIPADGGNITVHAYGRIEAPDPNNLTFQAVIKNHVLTVVLQQADLSKRGKENLTLDLDVPKQDYGSIQVNSVSGSVDMGNISVDTTNVMTSTGLVSVNNMNTNLAVNVDNGSVRVSDVRGKMNLQAGNGSVIVHESKIYDDISATADVGSVLIDTKMKGQSVRFQLTTQVGPITAKLPNQKILRSEPGKVVGYVGQGGPLIDASANNGAVTLSVSK